MAHQSNNPLEEWAIVPEYDEAIPTRGDESVLPVKPSELVSEMYQKVEDFCNNYYGGLEKFTSPEDPCGLLGIFLAHMPEYADEDRRHEFTVETFTSVVQLIMSDLATEDDPDDFLSSSERACSVVLELTEDRMAQPDHLGCKPVPAHTFDRIIGHAAHLETHHPRRDPVRFKYLSVFSVPLWNTAYNIPEKELKEKAAQRIMTSLEPLNVALKDFFSHSDSEPLPEVWSVINWWLKPPFSRGMFKPAPLSSRSVCLDHLKKLEGRLRASGHILDVEKADMVEKWLPEDINQARRNQALYDLYFRR